MALEGGLFWYNHLSFEDGFQFDFGKRISDIWLTRPDGFRITKRWHEMACVFSGQLSGGAFYAVDDNGDLYWSRHAGVADGRDWFYRFGTLENPIGTGWDKFDHIFAARSGVIYGVKSNGDLMWYRHAGYRSGAKNWAKTTGVKVGTGWDRFTQVFASTGGRIYAVEANGDLKWYHHTGWRNGDPTWRFNTERKIGTGWSDLKNLVTSGANIYGIDEDGNLNWYFHEGFRNGTQRWTFKTGRKIGTGWDIYQKLFCAGGGKLYGLICP